MADLSPALLSSGADPERALAELAARTVADDGGEVTFERYDALMGPKPYVAPLNWIAGWGLQTQDLKANRDKLCAFEAVRYGLLEQTASGYKVACNECR